MEDDISLLEAGRKATRLDTLHRIARSLSTSLPELFQHNTNLKAKERLVALANNCSEDEICALIEIGRVIKNLLASSLR